MDALRKSSKIKQRAQETLQVHWKRTYASSVRKRRNPIILDMQRSPLRSSSASLRRIHEHFSISKPSPPLFNVEANDL